MDDDDRLRFFGVFWSISTEDFLFLEGFSFFLEGKDDVEATRGSVCKEEEDEKEYADDDAAEAEEEDGDGAGRI